MKLSKIFAPLVLLAAASSATTISSLTTPAKRDVLDLCVDLIVDVGEVLEAALHIVLLDLGGAVELCLCVSALPLFIQTNLVAVLAADIVGTQAVLAVLVNLIEGSDPHSCTLPDNATPVCSASNPCGFTCNPPFVKSTDGTTCVLPPSSKAKRSQQDIIHQAQIKSGQYLCSSGQQLCAIWGGYASARAFECVDVLADLFSCGGCPGGTSLSSYGDYEGETEATGVDCSTIQGVSDVACVTGACRVRKCVKGWKVSQNGTGCDRV